MDIKIEEDRERVIGCRELNRYVEQGSNSHQETRIAPDSFFNELPSIYGKEISERYNYLQKTLTEKLGGPFFSDEGFIIYNGDCVDLLKRLSTTDLRFDLTITSPPYNIGKEYEEPKPLKEFIDWCSTWMELIYKLTKANGSFWLNVGYFEVEGKGLCVPIPYLLWDKSSFYMLQEVVWKYGAGVQTRRQLSPRNEKWIFYVMDRLNYTFNLDEIRDPNVKYPHQKKNGKFRCNPLGKNPSDVWEFPKVTTGKQRSSKERTGHPAQFPLGIVERIIRSSSNPTEFILDPFLGSGSAGICASSFGRPFVGFELRPDYCEIAVNRYLNFKRQKKSFLKQEILF